MTGRPPPASARGLFALVNRRARALLETLATPHGPAPDDDGETAPAETTQPDAQVARATLRVVESAGGVLDTLGRAAEAMERVAHLQEGLTRQLTVVARDLGELVRLNLIEARARLADRAPARTPVLLPQPVSDSEQLASPETPRGQGD